MILFFFLIKTRSEGAAGPLPSSEVLPVPVQAQKKGQY